MKLSDIKPTEALKVLLQHNNVEGTIYAFGERISNLPKQPFIEISFNGDVRRKSIQQGIFETTLLLSIHVPLLANDVVNKNKQTKILNDIENVIGRSCSVEIRDNKQVILSFAGQTLVYDGDILIYNEDGEQIKFEYSINPSVAVINAKSIVAGFSTFGINLKCLIYKI